MEKLILIAGTSVAEYEEITMLIAGEVMRSGKGTEDIRVQSDHRYTFCSVWNRIINISG